MHIILILVSNNLVLLKILLDSAELAYNELEKVRMLLLLSIEHHF